MQTQSDSGNVKATRTQEKQASIAPHPLMPFDPFSTKHTAKVAVHFSSLPFLSRFSCSLKCSLTENKHKNGIQKNTRVFQTISNKSVVYLKLFNAFRNEL